MSQVFTSGSFRHTIDVHDHLDEHIVLEANTSGTLILFVKGHGTLNLTVDLHSDASWTYLWVNQSDLELEVVESINMDSGSKLHANFAELSKGKHDKKTVFNLIGDRAVIEFRSATLSFKNITWVIKAHHQARRTEAHLNTYGIVLENAGLEFEVIGKIDKGNSGSKTHQLTRILNLGDKLRTIVYPKLLIDENDVEASHAASVGQPNEEHIYYMQSRGIKRLDALKLIVLGYLLPVAYEVEDEDIREYLVNEIQEKVGHEWTR